MEHSENIPSAELPDEGLIAATDSAKVDAEQPALAEPAVEGDSAPPKISKKQMKRNFEQQPRNPDLSRIVDYIADILGEKETEPRSQIFRILLYCGIELGLDALEKTIQIQAEGGMAVLDGSRMRTFGGAYFATVREMMSPEQRSWTYFVPKRVREQQVMKQKVIDVEVWNERLSMLEGLLQERGAAKNVKVTIIGRPGKVEVRPDVVVTTMEHVPQAMMLPRGVPPLPETPTVYLVYISAKQWRKVEERLSNPEDVLIIDGVPSFDPQTGMMVIHTTGVTTKLTEAAKRENQRVNRAEQPAAEGGEQAEAQPDRDEAAPAPEPKPKKAKAEAQPQQPKEPPVTGAFSALPPHIAQKLNELYSSAAVFRQKLATIQAKPAGQQFGLEMTQKLLKNVEDEIAALEKQYAK